MSLELERRMKIALDKMRKHTKWVRDNTESLPDDAPRFGSFAKDNPEVHGDMGDAPRPQKD